MEQESVNSQESAKEEPRPYATWEPLEIAKYHAEHLREEDPEISEDDAFDQAYADQDLYDHEWDYLLGSLTEKMGEINKDGYWHASVDNFGWRNLSGCKTFKAEDGKEFLSAVLPDCECIFHIFVTDDVQRGGKMFYIKNWHHDSPMGESYYVWRLSEAKFLGEEEEVEDE